MADYSASFREGGALQFDAASINDLATAARDYLDTDPKVTIEFVGDHKISSTDLKQLLDDPYIRSLQIKLIKIDGSQYKVEPRRSFDLSVDPDFSFMGAVDVTIRGDRDAAVMVRDKIEKTLRGCWLWYARLFRPIDPTFAAFRLVFATLAIFASIFATYTVIRGFPATSEDALKQGGETLLLTPLFYQVTAFLKRRLFPKLLFSIGKSSDAVNAAAYWRNIVFVAVILAIIASIAATLITDRFK
ncbi:MULTISPECIES: hypothetical protein [Bradyrhizobium]|jgi:hypothetical protein|uniref:Uncharacterized protein n=2 Tax=Bradyrhizobium TaxID=374 RepID=A0ABY0PAX7_9BRAD|nr:MULTISPECIES: hypothetical protein [Bradyrhizobium]SDH55680.1 hypothetical protein SAMN05444163_0407 [Bradyrhizobium ottawaense]SEE23984.1 hypothetical protein SAMN05444171_6762 [Bradyrhizobium lablabi]SHM20341.1 hypothetical protein SAMN05444321_5563 [Bradyrhizobium lablabi]